MNHEAIELVEVGKRYGGLQAVSAVSMNVVPGERRILIGPNGAGKTTLFHCITGTLRASSGSVRFFGTDVTKLDEARRTQLGMGRTFQISNVFMDLTVAENVLIALLGKDARKWVVHRTLPNYKDLYEQALQGLVSVALEARADEPAKLLSYGERRQLELALALQTGPRVLFLDEPCAGLSPSERQHLSDLIARLPRDITLLMIEHDMDVALALADRVTVMHRGTVILEGSPDEVQSDPDVREVYFGQV